MRHFLSMHDLTTDECGHLIDLSLRVKGERSASKDQSGSLHGRVLGLMFEKPSMRTRVSFEVAIAHLGGASVFLTGEGVGLGQRESIADFARVVSTYVDLLAARTFSHSVIVELAANASCPVINALSDALHPCQALADLCTIKEQFGRLEGIRLAFVGDGNNVARSLAHGSICNGLEFVLSAPAGYEFTEPFLSSCQRGAPGSVALEPDPNAAVANADVIYTDVWASMGQETERAERLKTFQPYQVNQTLMSRAKPSAVFLHCLPAHRGEEVTSEVIDGPQSMVVPQAANRLHAQKALMLWLLGKSGTSAATC